VLEDVADNLFHADPYSRQGGDMVRVAGMSYALDPAAKVGARVSDLRIGGAPMGADTAYKVAGWASVQEGVSGEPVWEVAARHLREAKTVRRLAPAQPRLRAARRA
jgi:sulfur-oxidizing protein SoxB